MTTELEAAAAAGDVAKVTELVAQVDDYTRRDALQAAARGRGVNVRY